MIKQFSQPKQQAKAIDQKNSPLFRRNNRLFITVNNKQTEFKELEIERLYTVVYTGSLQIQSYIQSSQKP